jgi:crotonobetainyl-CoA:carnitine CoA-transferase CaiB-like acyl-CoA transferase
VRIAWERFLAQVPTPKRQEPRRADVIAVGTYNPRDGEVVIDRYFEELVLRFLAIAPEALERECQSTHPDHERRRRIRSQIANAGKNRAQAEAARECARRHGYDDLLR